MTSSTPFKPSLPERAPALLALLGVLDNAQDLPVAIVIDTNRN